VWVRVLDLARHRFSSSGTVDELREMWGSFLWHEDVSMDVATPGSVAFPWCFANAMKVIAIVMTDS